MNTYRSDLNLFSVFQAILETRSVTLAADRFGITQPAMSNALTRLRQLLGDPLFVNSTSGMQPTPYALEIAETVVNSLAGLQQALDHRKSFDPALTEQTFRFHIPDMGQVNILPMLLERVQRVAPRVRIQTETLPQEDVRTALENGRIHFAAGHLPRLHGRRLRTQHLFDERYVVLMRAGHPLAVGTLTQKALLQASHAVVTSVGGGHQIIEEVLQKRRARIVTHLPNIMALAMAVARTDLVAIVPRRVATELAKGGTLHVARLPIAMPCFDVAIYWHERSHTSPACIWMREQLMELFMGRAE
ncbi:MAG: LysR family transcriptional regulator [Pigmentiphaga sp.]|uniref:LysR family transcriptional regulator n=1 Tax=Pigmentiphaga sp. TaxID=1977564 RepID=UPI0029B18A70|nr:LysR family transcriptional regulator [Pigmentiphaga sp.]MDX3905439.1 LysR family transcriptional regulator [Pigmentiphaga sp.]